VLKAPPTLLPAASARATRAQAKEERHAHRLIANIMQPRTSEALKQAPGESDPLAGFVRRINVKIKNRGHARPKKACAVIGRHS